MKRLILVSGLLLAAALLTLVSCAKAPTPSSGPPTAYPAPTPTPAPAPIVSMPPGRGDYSKESGAGALPSSADERMIVRNGNISLIVNSVVGARDEITQLATRLGGYVVSSWISGEKAGMRGSISIRVPDETFEPAFVELRKLAVRVESENTNSQDVTEEYIDLEARLKNAQATESQYLALLNKAEKVDDILQIYDSLARVRSEIEQIKGRMQYLERTSSMSLITVELRPVASSEPLAPVGWSALEALKSAIRGIATFGKWLATVIIWLVIFVPVWGSVLGIILWRRHRRKIAQ